MNNQKNGVNFEVKLKRLLTDNGLKVLNLGFNEVADLIIIDGKARIIECKRSHKAIWYRKNAKQYDRLMKLVSLGFSVYIAIEFIINRKSIIKFYYLPESPYPYKIDNGYTLEEFIRHCGL
jgi:Holliday junction resolvase